MKQEYAFPSPVDPKTGTNQLGITVRDYFAAKAMQGDISAFTTTNNTQFDAEHWDITNIAKRAYAMADAMMEARK